MHTNIVEMSSKNASNIPLTRVKNNVVVTLSGDVLIVSSIRRGMSKIWNFEIYKMDSSKGNKWEQTFSLGNEAIILDLGITVPAKDIEGIKRNSIYFSATDDDQHDKMMFSYSISIQRRLNTRSNILLDVHWYNWFYKLYNRTMDVQKNTKSYVKITML